MPPRRSRVNRKVDHRTYVQQLFRDFLHRNQPKQGTAPEVRPNLIDRPLQCFPIENPRNNVFRQGVYRNYAQTAKETRNSVQKFFSKPAPKIEEDHDLDQAFYVRFQRHEGSDHFVKREPSPLAPTGLVEWLARRRQTKNEQAPFVPYGETFRKPIRKGTDYVGQSSSKQHESMNYAGEQNRRGFVQWVEMRKNSKDPAKEKQRNGEYLHLPGSFFSGQDSIKLPFQTTSAADKTLTSVGSVFVPPATSTPFDSRQMIGTSIVSDPDDLIQPQIPLQKIIHCDDFLKEVAASFENFNAILCKTRHAPMDKNYHELKKIISRGSIKEASHPLDKSKTLYQTEKQATSPSIFTNYHIDLQSKDPNDKSMVIEVQLGCDRKPKDKSAAETSMDSFKDDIFRLPNPPVRKLAKEASLIFSPSPARERCGSLERELHNKQNVAEETDIDFFETTDLSFLNSLPASYRQETTSLDFDFDVSEDAFNVSVSSENLFNWSPKFEQTGAIEAKRNPEPDQFMFDFQQSSAIYNFFNFDGPLEQNNSLFSPGNTQQIISPLRWSPDKKMPRFELDSNETFFTSQRKSSANNFCDIREVRKENSFDFSL